MPWWAALYVCVLAFGCIANHAVELPALLRKKWIHAANWISMIFLSLFVYAYYSDTLAQWLGPAACGMLVFSVTWAVYEFILSRRVMREIQRKENKKSSGREENDLALSRGAEWISLSLSLLVTAPAYYAGILVVLKL